MGLPPVISAWGPVVGFAAEVADLAAIVAALLYWLWKRYQDRADRLVHLNSLLRKPPFPGKTPARQLALGLMFLFSGVGAFVMIPLGWSWTAAIDLGYVSSSPSYTEFFIVQQSTVGLAYLSAFIHRKRLYYEIRIRQMKRAERRMVGGP